MITGNISIKILLKRFWKNAAVTWILVILEGVILLLFPLVIGWAVDGFIDKNLTGLYQLTGLCMALLILGSGRRFYDTRAYGKIYKTVSNEIVSKHLKNKTGVSAVSAKTNLFTEFIEFLENSIPDIFSHIIGLAGTLLIILAVDYRVFIACITGTASIYAVFYLSSNKMMLLNKGQNDELEKQVDLISNENFKDVKGHFKRLNRWNILLSDLETINFSMTWITLSIVLIVSVFLVASSNNTTNGQILTVIMYVFGFIESILTFPLYYQQIIRLKEIARRL